MKKKTTTASKSTGRGAALAESVEDRRDTPRLKLPRVEAEIVSLGLRVTVLEVGFGGLSIESKHEFEVGEIHELRYGASKDVPVVLRGRVKHCRLEHATRKPARYVTGFQFVEAWCPGDHSALDEFISLVTMGISSGKRR